MSEEILGHYRILSKLGEGGMGVVYSATDERLGRDVALKRMRPEADADARERLRREARAAAAVSHSRICRIYDIGEHEGELFIAMELLDGEPLSARLERGAVGLEAAIRITCEILEGLEALHRKQIIHRDLKPSNVFIGTEGVKLVDFGLALPLGGSSSGVRLTLPGAVVGTPAYMAPEQWEGRSVGPETDLFACGALLFEMLTGRRAFEGDSIASLCRTILGEQPPALTGGGSIDAVDRVIQKALAKRPGDRYPSAKAMADALAGAKPASDATVRLEPVRTVRRLIVLPFRLLRPDPEIDFLAVSLPDAITASLCGLGSLVVRSPRAAAGVDTAAPDLRKLAQDAGVDVVLLGNLLRSGDRVRLQTQLVEVPAGTAVWSKTLQVPASDVFELEDELRDRVIEALALPLTQKEEERLDRDRPATGRAYELYLRAIEAGITTVSDRRMREARDLLRDCVAEDPGFAPAWARLGRVCRIVAKYGFDGSQDHYREAGDAFRRAFALNPELPIAHSYYTFFELEELASAPEAMVRLLGRVRERAADPEILSGLVAACRFSGLLAASVAAHERAKRLDPRIRTSVHFTYWLLGDFERAILADEDELSAVAASGLEATGRVDEAIALMKGVSSRIEGVEVFSVGMLLAAFEGRREDGLELAGRLEQSGFHDPEGIFVCARSLARLGETARALDLLERVVAKNYLCDEALTRDPWLERLRDEHRFHALLEDSRRRRQRAKEMYLEAGGPALLGS
jgi:serine/threonine protein kinase/tetratricopeptide (TPR) repeat protein